MLSLPTTLRELEIDSKKKEEEKFWNKKLPPSHSSEPVRGEKEEKSRKVPEKREELFLVGRKKGNETEKGVLCAQKVTTCSPCMRKGHLVLYCTAQNVCFFKIIAPEIVLPFVLPRPAYTFIFPSFLDLLCAFDYSGCRLAPSGVCVSCREKRREKPHLERPNTQTNQLRPSLSSISIPYSPPLLDSLTSTRCAACFTLYNIFINSPLFPFSVGPPPRKK